MKGKGEGREGGDAGTKDWVVVWGCMTLTSIDPRRETSEVSLVMNL